MIKPDRLRLAILGMTVKGQRKIKQRVLQVLPQIVAVKVITEEEIGTRKVVLDTNLEDSD